MEKKAAGRNFNFGLVFSNGCSLLQHLKKWHQGVLVLLSQASYALGEQFLQDTPNHGANPLYHFLSRAAIPFLVLTNVELLVPSLQDRRHGCPNLEHAGARKGGGGVQRP